MIRTLSLTGWLGVGAAGTLVILAGLWQYEKAQAADARADAAMWEGRAQVLTAQVALNERTAQIDAQRLVTITAAMTGAADATTEINNAGDIDTAIDAYLRGLGVVLDNGTGTPADADAD